MRKTLLIFLPVIMLITCRIYSQSTEANFQFRKVSKEEMEMKQYKPDPNAEAVVLFDKGTSEFVEAPGGGFDIIFERVTRIKILNEAGLDWAEVEIPYYQEGGIFEIVENIEGYTYNEVDGRTVTTALDTKTLYTETLNQFWNIKKFVMPNVRSGSVIEYRYKINSQYISRLRDWEFQSGIPTVHSEYITRMIPFYSYSWILQGAKKFTSHSAEEARGLSRVFGNVTFHDMIHRFVMEDVPAFRDEDFITSYNDYIIKIDFQLEKITNTSGIETPIRTTWEEMIKFLDRSPSFGKYADRGESDAGKDDFIKELLYISEPDRINLITTYVKNNYAWNGMYGIHATQQAKEFSGSKRGSVADINLYLTGALRSAGIEAYPVIMSTRSNGRIKSDYPFYHFFNYVIVLARSGNELYLIDGTEPLNSFNRLPTRCINDRGLVIKKGSEDWISVNFDNPSSETTRFVIGLKENCDSLKANVSIIADEYEALSYRKNYGEETKKLADNLREKGYTVTEKNITLKNARNPEEPVSIDAEAVLRCESIGDKIYIPPFLYQVISENPLRQDKRTLPLDFTYPVTRNYNSMILIPPGYEVDWLPDNRKISNDMYEFEFSTVSSGNSIGVNLTYSLKQARYPASGYRALKTFFNDIITLGSERVVLKKVTTSSKEPQQLSQSEDRDR